MTHNMMSEGKASNCNIIGTIRKKIVHCFDREAEKQGIGKQKQRFLEIRTCCAVVDRSIRCLQIMQGKIAMLDVFTFTGEWVLQ